MEKQIKLLKKIGENCTNQINKKSNLVYTYIKFVYFTLIINQFI